MSSRPTVALTLVAAALGLSMIAACGDDDGRSSQADALEGRTYLSTSVVGHELVGTTRARLAFTDGQLRASAGCNTLTADYTIDAGRLVIASGGVAMTEMGCDPALHAQDAWLAELLASSPTVEVAGPELTLANATVTMRLLDREVAEPDRPLAGTTWRVDTVIIGDSASSVAAGAEVTLRFDGASGFEVAAAGCTSAHGPVEVGPHTLEFGDFVVDAIGCPAPWNETLAVLRGGRATYTIDGDRLTVRSDTSGIAAIAQDR